jgi:hypothetical protein
MSREAFPMPTRGVRILKLIINEKEIYNNESLLYHHLMIIQDIIHDKYSDIKISEQFPVNIIQKNIDNGKTDKTYAYAAIFIMMHSQHKYAKRMIEQEPGNNGQLFLSELKSTMEYYHTGYKLSGKEFNVTNNNELETRSTGYYVKHLIDFYTTL